MELLILSPKAFQCCSGCFEWEEWQAFIYIRWTRCQLLWTNSQLKNRSKSKSCPLQNWWKFGFSLSSSSSNRDQTNFGLSSAQSMFISWLSEGCLMQCLVGKVANPIVRKCIYTDHDWIDAGRCSNRLCSWFVLLRVLCRENGDVERNLGLRCRLSLEMMLKSLSNQHYQKYYSLFICEHAWSFVFLSNHMKLFFTFHKPF